MLLKAYLKNLKKKKFLIFVDLKSKLSVVIFTLTFYLFMLFIVSFLYASGQMIGESKFQ